MMSNNSKCTECDCVKCYAINYQIYFCNHEDRTDDMGKLGIGKLPDVAPDWCPKRNNK